MTKKRMQEEEEILLQAINEAILDKKGQDIVNIDLRQTDAAIASHFVICSAGSTIQAKAIAEHIERKIRSDIRERPWHSEGYENCVWILLDYVNIVVHVFEKSTRDFYHLEKLWSDAKFTHIGEDGKLIAAN
ncbi:MAG TPA: ribosome silencing factor [Bacteroidales bacterium]|nr:ribosome silencing factor [Bacteroidales bacterium]